MPGRMLSPYDPNRPVPTFLSWGEASDEPRSSVRDAHGVYVFPGSPVQVLHLDLAGVVAKLVNSTEVVVVWERYGSEAEKTRTIDSSRIVVTGHFPADRRKSWH